MADRTDDDHAAADRDRALQQLVALAFWQLCFFDQVEEEVLDLDTCVQQEESITGFLREAGPLAQELFARLAEHVAAGDDRPAVREFARRAVEEVWDDDWASGD